MPNNNMVGRNILYGMDAENVAFNITNRALDPAAMSILSKGLNYAQTTSLKSNLKDFISGVERAYKQIPTETAEKIRQETCRFLRHSKPRKTNMSQADRDALQALRKDKDITAFPADKWKATVVLLSDSYRRKIRKVLSDPVYRKLTADQINKIERCANALIMKSEISNEDVKKLTPHVSAAFRLYGLPKFIRRMYHGEIPHRTNESASWPIRLPNQLL
jgi:predicted transcriptional regulator